MLALNVRQHSVKCIQGRSPSPHSALEWDANKLRETVVLLPNNQRQHRTSHASKDVLPLRKIPAVWYFIAEQPAPAPHLARPEGRAAPAHLCLLLCSSKLNGSKALYRSPRPNSGLELLEWFKSTHHSKEALGDRSMC
jgi:hypothetical protein